MFYDDVELGEDAVIGQPGQGAGALFDGLNPERLIVAAQAVGLGRWGSGGGARAVGLGRWGSGAGA